MSDVQGAKNAGWSVDEYTKLVGFEGDWRDSWYNQDYLELLASRLGFQDVQTVLDVGCGAGHWGQRLATVLPPDVTFVGIDHEAAFLESARARAEGLGLASRFTYQAGEGEKLSFADDSFDLVTCQTVLMHVAEAKSVLQEMLRVTKPGGLVLASEPNNLANALMEHMGSARIPIEDTLELMRFQQICQKGKIALGQGDSAIGERLPTLFSELGATDIVAYRNDRCPTLLPPYRTAFETVQVEQLLTWIDAEVSGFGARDKAIEFYRAGGGDEARFERVWATHLRCQKTIGESLRDKTYSSAGGQMHYLVSARKPLV